MSDPPSITDHQKSDRQQERVVHQRRGRMLSKRKSVEEEQLEAFRELRIEVVGNAHEPVSPVVICDEAQVVGHCIGAHLRRHRVKKIEDGEQAKDRAEEPLPFLGQRWKLAPFWPVRAGIQRVPDGEKTQRQENALARQVRRG